MAITIKAKKSNETYKSIQNTHNNIHHHNIQLTKNYVQKLIRLRTAQQFLYNLIFLQNHVIHKYRTDTQCQ